MKAAGLLLALVLAGCVVPGTLKPAGTDPLPRCVHPFPCGDEWPLDLVPPFELDEVVALDVAGRDGTPIEAWLHRPKVPEGARLPVVLMSTPYPGTCASNALACFPRGDDPSTTTRIDTELLARHGYAVVLANVRGTGNSGGCFEMGGANEQADQAALVEALAAQPWSNGRVGMIGHSYPSFTAWMAAVQAPPALKTIVVSGHMTDLYTTVHTPQGAAAEVGGPFYLAYAATLGLVPPLGAPLAHATLGHAPVAPERACEEATRAMLETARGARAGERDGAFWDARRLIDRVPDVTASVLIVSGHEDSASLFHAFQDDEAWRLLDAPKRAIYGHWGHDLPPPAKALEGAPFGEDWYEDALLPWLDFWLKGIGEPPRLGIVDHEVGGATWRTSSAWPPADARPEVLYLSDGALEPRGGGAPTTLRLAPDATFGPVCTESTHVFATPPVEAPVTLAGNPLAYLRLESDVPGGVVSVDLYDLEPGFACGDEAGWRWLAGGAADLRYHASGFRAIDFPVGTPTQVRIDINNQGWRFDEGHRLALVVSPLGWQLRAAQPFAPRVTLHAEGGAEASHLVVPLVEGSFGGAAPTLEYPPRPFAPS